MFEAFIVALASVWNDSGFSALTGGHVIMIVVGLVLLYMAIGKGFEPLLLSPIAFGCILANSPKNGFELPGVMSVIMYGIHHEVFPPLIFLGVGAMTDFGPLIANPKTLLLGAAAQAGVFISLLGAMMRGISVEESLKIAVDYTLECMIQTLEDENHRFYGVNFETALPEYIKMINKSLGNED